VGNLKVVLFGPWDLNLIVESPSTRRKFMDMVLSQVDREYRRSLLSYEKGVRQRNRVLERIREGDATRSQLLFWNQLLVREGNFITDRRGEFVEFVNATPSVGEEFSLEYDRSTISETRLEQYAREEVAAASTLVGPHRDDIVFKISKESFKTRKNLNVYGSRGEQRMAVLWVKLAELSFVEKKSGERPVLLLDDIFSELDPAHHDLIMDTTHKQQTILTTAEPRAISSWGEIDVVTL
jgi:DNA replication and repair protein RecF